MEEVDVEKPRQLQAEDGRDANPVSKNDSKKRHLDELLATRSENRFLLVIQRQLACYE